MTVYIRSSARNQFATWYPTVDVHFIAYLHRVGSLVWRTSCSLSTKTQIFSLSKITSYSASQKASHLSKDALLAVVDAGPGAFGDPTRRLRDTSLGSSSAPTDTSSHPHAILRRITSTSNSPCSIHLSFKKFILLFLVVTPSLPAPWPPT